MPARRLVDRIYKLSRKVARIAKETPEAQKLIAQIKADMTDYFEREKNPPYTVERRAASQQNERRSTPVTR